jgi:uncharacterized membrane protein required for colicin V production
MDLLDVAILIVIALGLLLGYSRGILRALIPELAVVGVAVLLYARPELVRMVPLLPGPLTVFVALLGSFILAVLLSGQITRAIRMIPIAKPADRVAGAIFNGALAFLLVYSLLLAMISFDAVVQPITHAVSLTGANVGALRAALQANPQFSWLVDDHQITRMQQDATAQPVQYSDLSYYDFTVATYEMQLRPQLVQSRLAPVVLRVGERLPIVGRRGATTPPP